VHAGIGTKVREKNQEEGQFKIRTLCIKRKECGTPNCNSINYNTGRQKNPRGKLTVEGRDLRDRIGPPRS
jgi:hypothetical protein